MSHVQHSACGAPDIFPADGEFRPDGYCPHGKHGASELERKQSCCEGAGGDVYCGRRRGRLSSRAGVQDAEMEPYLGVNLEIRAALG